MKVAWTVASDNVSATSNLQYKIVYSTSDNISTTALATANGIEVAAYATGVSFGVMTGLTANSTYYFNVLVRDEAGNISSYTSAQQTTANFCGGTGASTSPYVICTLAALNSMRENLSSYYQLANDIDASSTANWSYGEGWLPVGTDSAAPFTGNFSGENFVIRGLSINRPSTDNVGLFGYVNLGSRGIRRVGLQDVSIVGKYNVGSLAGRVTAGYLEYIYASGSISGASAIGGITGNLASSVPVQYIFSDVVLTNSGANSGGLAGSANANISYAYATGNVKGVDQQAGLLGGYYVEGKTLSYAYSTGNVSGSTHTGGIVGSIIGSTAGVAVINAVINTGNVHATSARLGGIAGWIRGNTEIKYAINEGHLWSSWYTGGIGGLITPQPDNATLSHVLSTGRIVATAGARGSISGTESPPNMTYTSIYGFKHSDNLGCSTGTALAACNTVTTGTTKPFVFGFSPELNFVQMKYLESPSIPMRKISATDQNSYKMSGSCTVHAAVVNITATDGSLTINDTSTCDVYSWSKHVVLSTLSDGAVTITANQAGSFSKSLNLSKETNYCGGSPSNVDFAAGDGSSGSPYLICTISQFDKVRNYTSAGVYFKLMNNLDLRSGFSGPIGSDDNGDCTSRFCGKFDGNGFILSNAYILKPDTAKVGIFGYIADSSAVIEKLGLENIHVMAAGEAGTLIGYMENGTVRNNYVQGHVMGVATTFFPRNQLGIKICASRFTKNESGYCLVAGSNIRILR